MNLLTVLLGVLGGSLVLAALSWKWCLPGRKTSAIILLATVVAFGCGWLALRSGWSWWLVLGVSGAAQLIVYVGTILWIFYLDPERKVLSDPRLVLSPADGTVVYIRQLEAGEPLRSDKNGAAMILDEFNATDLARTPLWQIGISMVFTDVHVNRSPIRGKVTLLKHRSGQFLELELHAGDSHIIGGGGQDRDRGTRDGGAAGGRAVMETVGGVASEVSSVSSVSRKGTNARHWSLEQLRMWRAWVRR